MRNADRIILELKRVTDLDDDQLANRIGISRQTVNQVCRALARKGVVIREHGGPKGKLINRFSDGNSGGIPADHDDRSQSVVTHAELDITRAPPARETAKIQIGGYEFERVCEITPLRDGEGVIQAFFPQSRYHNNEKLRLNKYGHGPFCKFKIPNNVRQPGVYAIVVDGDTKYVGECANLSNRYNMGYGNISPRNCFIRGQETNCRLNNLIYHASTNGHRITLWFHRTERFKSLERHLRTLLGLKWNRI